MGGALVRSQNPEPSSTLVRSTSKVLLSRSSSATSMLLPAVTTSILRSIPSSQDFFHLLSPTTHHYYYFLKKQLTTTMILFDRDSHLHITFLLFLENEWLKNNELLPILLKSSSDGEEDPLRKSPLPCSDGIRGIGMKERINVSIREFYQQIMFNFLFEPNLQLKSTSSLTLASRTASTVTSQNSSAGNDITLESPYETTFFDYSIDLSEEAHKKASLLAQLKNRQGIAQPRRTDRWRERSENEEEDDEDLTPWTHSYLSFELCRDFLLLFLFSVYQEINREGYYELKFPVLPPLPPSPTVKIEHTEQTEEHSINFHQHDDTINDDESRKMMTVMNHHHEIPSSSDKVFAMMERQKSERLHHQRYQALNQLFDQVHKRLCKTTPQFMNYSSAGQWSDVSCFFRHLDQLSLPLSIAAVEKDGNFCPLVYVNPAFERLTQYSRAEVVGKTCNFLQSPKTEKCQTAKVRKALGASRLVKVGITNQKKDGTHFFNLLALLPVHDRFGQYRYVIGKQEDITNQQLTTKSLQASEDVLYWIALVLRNF